MCIRDRSTAVLHLEGNVISNAPKKEAANTTSIRQKRILNTAFVESAFSALAQMCIRDSSGVREPRNTEPAFTTRSATER